MKAPPVAAAARLSHGPGRRWRSGQTSRALTWPR